MRIGLFEGPRADRAIRPGVVTDDSIVDVSSATAHLAAHSPQHLMTQIIDHFEALRPAFERLSSHAVPLPLDIVRIRPPLRREAQARGEPEPEGGWQNWVPEGWEGHSHG